MRDTALKTHLTFKTNVYIVLLGKLVPLPISTGVTLLGKLILGVSEPMCEKYSSDQGFLLLLPAISRPKGDSITR